MHFRKLPPYPLSRDDLDEPDLWPVPPPTADAQPQRECGPLAAACFAVTLLAAVALAALLISLSHRIDRLLEILAR